MDYNYSEIICTAIDEIVTAKLQGLEYDVTKQCTVVDDSQSHKGKYIVSDGTSKYEAYSTDISFKKGNSVLVTIPNGNYDLQKTIVCRISADDTTPFNYTSPMDTMIKITNNIFDDAKVVYGENIGLLANDTNQSTAAGPIYSLTESAGFAGFTRLGITANFKSLLNGLDVASGTYGLKLLIYTENSISPGVKDNAVYELSFNSSDMIGNPYQFDSYFYQEKVFDISSINNIKQIDVYFYQNGQFYDGNNNYIEWQYIDSLLGATKLQNNLFVDDVKIYLGYDMGAFSGETLLLYTNDALTYHYTNDPLYKTVALRWIHKLDDNTYQLLGLSDLKDEFEVHWFRYKKGHETIDKYAGNDWEELPAVDDNEFKCEFAPDIAARSEQIKVIGLQKTITGTNDKGEDIITETPYYSNLMIFENEENVPDKITYDAATALSIVCEDGSEGNYFLYNQNGKIENEGNGQGNKRYWKAMFQGAEIDSNLGLGESDFIKWYFPVENTMLTFSNDYFTENEGEKTEDIKSYYGVDYYEISRGTTNVTISGKPELTSVKQAYSIGNQWNQKNANNTIRCVVRIKGVEYEAVEELRFGKAGTNGTNATFLIEFVNNSNALIIGKNNTVTVRARLYDSNGSNVGFHQSQANTIQWSWYKQTPNKNYISLPSGVQSDVITLTCNTDTLPQDNYYILKATYGMLEAYLPIPLKTKNASHMEGAREIIYNNQGTPSYYSDAYVLYSYNSDGYKDSEALWTIKYNEETNGMSASYIPTLKDIPQRKGYKGLQASPFYASGYNDMVCVSGQTQNGDCGWSQPILIMQSQYDFAMLNKWDGTLTMDENNGTILSTMLGAGRKNSNNTFSGILIGDVQKGTSNSNDTNTLTGVYGLHEGVTSFELKEDGTATFGKKGHGQILIDGNSSTIQSAQYISNNTGMMLDLDDGIIDIKGSAGERVLLQSKSPYFSINTSTAYTGDDNEFQFQPLINIGTDSFFIQSDNYTSTSNQGTKFNLQNGDLEIKSPYSRTYLSGGGKNSSTKYFEISVPPLSGTKPGTATGVSGYTTPLLTVGANEYYLQSINYDGLKFNEATINGTSYNLYNNGLVAVSSDGKIVYTRSNASSTDWSLKSFSATTEVIQLYDADGKEKEKVTKTITQDQNREAYLATLTPYYTKTQGSGLKMDLSSGVINGYDIMLKGTNSASTDENPKTIIIDSSSSTTPLKVGKDFSVAWDGTLTCYKLNEISNVDNEQQYAININDIFYVTKGGGAGGSGVSFSGGFSGSFGGVGSGTFKGKGMFDELYVGGVQYKKETIYFIQTVGLVRDGKNVKLNYFQHNMDVLCSRFARGSMQSTSAKLDHTHNIGESTTQRASGTTNLHYHYYLQRKSYTEGMN